MTLLVVGFTRTLIVVRYMTSLQSRVTTIVGIGRRVSSHGKRKINI